MRVVVEKPVTKFLRKHPDVARRFFVKVDLLERDGLDAVCDIRPLIGTSDRRRLRIGGYRFLFRVEDDQLVIYFYGANTRGDVYK